jgi:hypothetical protein
MMKSFSKIIFPISVLLIVVIGCKKEPDDATKLLIGKWDQASLTIVTYLDNVQQNETDKTYNEGDIVLEMLDDGTAKKYVRGVISDAFYWTVDGELLIMTGNNGIVQTAEFSVNETDLTLMWAVQETSDGHLIRSDYMSIYNKQ